MHIVFILALLAHLFFIHHAVSRQKHWIWILILMIPWVGLAVYIVSEYLPDRQSKRPALKVISGDASAPDDTVRKKGVKSGAALAYLSGGKLYHKTESAPPEPVQSPFAQKLIDQAVRTQQQNEWKTKGSGSFLSGSQLWGTDPESAEKVNVNFTAAVCHEKEGLLYYLIESDSSGGLFAYDPRSREEVRLFHKENFHATDLDLHPETGDFICAQHFGNGTANLAMIEKGSAFIKELTKGDSVDTAPSWIPGSGRQLLFQSAGIARNSDGYRVGTGPISIQALDLDNNRMTSVLSDDAYDYLQPHISPDGRFYYIRRPHEAGRYSDSTALLDFVLFPFRLLRAVFHYLNFFSLVYSKKPLTTASGPRMQGDDMKTIMLKGKIIDAEKALKKEPSILGVPSLVPGSWELIRRETDGSETVIARHAAAFDIGPDGTLVYSNGCGIFDLTGETAGSLVCRANLIEEVLIG